MSNDGNESIETMSKKKAFYDNKDRSVGPDIRMIRFLSNFDFPSVKSFILSLICILSLSLVLGPFDNEIVNNVSRFSIILCKVSHLVIE